MKFLETVRSHRLLLIGVPLVILALLLVIQGVTWLSGRAPSDPSLQPDMLIVLALRAGVIIVALVFTVLVKRHEAMNKAFNDVPACWQAYCASRAHTLFLIGMFCYVLTH